MVERKPAAAHRARARLHRVDWARAALQALRDGGLAAIVVETLAERMHTTKGSFYWHFTDRDELIQAALEVWEQDMTDAVMARLEAVGPPLARLRELFGLVFDDSFEGSMIVALATDTADVRIGPTLQRVSRRRLAYLMDALVACGLPAERAYYHAFLATTSFTGYHSVRRVLPDEPAFGVQAASYLDHVWRVLASELPPEAERP
jgi:AcrR family transcriptional regulator